MAQHSIKRMQTRRSAGPVVPCLISSLSRATSGADTLLSPAARRAKHVAHPGVALCPSLCQGSVWQLCKGWLRLGWQLDRAGGGGMQHQPGRSWGSSEVWLLGWACRCHFPHYQLQHVTDSQSCCTATRGFGSWQSSRAVAQPAMALGTGATVHGLV